MLNKTVAGNESWVHHYQTESKHASMQWKHPSSPSTKKVKVTNMPSAGKVMLTVFLDSQGVLLVHFQKRGENVNSASYCEVLLKLWDAISRECPGQLSKRVLLLHIVRATQDSIQELQWELLQYPPYSPDLAPSNFHLFGPLKCHLGGKRLTDEEVKTKVRKWLRQ
jgi:histone-lysine N-methyltransferase SETMAR